MPPGVLLRCELERERAVSLRPRVGEVRLVRERWRKCPMAGSASASGDEMRAECGRFEGFWPGEDMEAFLANGLLRELRAKGRPLGAGALMAEVLAEVYGGGC